LVAVKTAGRVILYSRRELTSQSVSNTWLPLHIVFYAFDVLVRRGKDMTKQTLSNRREILASTVKPTIT
jgi:ATP-dependent DNA ligase